MVHQDNPEDLAAVVAVFLYPQNGQEKTRRV
jgi:hypothetical protein